MTSPLTFEVWAESLETMSYYDVLRVAEDAPQDDIQRAFHELSLRCHPDRFIDEPVEVGHAASAVFKRLVEAYGVLRRPKLRARYDDELRRGQVKLDEHAVEQKPTYEQRTLFMIATTPRGKKHAAQADQFLASGQLDAARVQLVSAHQQEPMNAELKERLDILYEAMALEPPDF